VSRRCTGDAANSIGVVRDSYRTQFYAAGESLEATAAPLFQSTVETLIVTDTVGESRVLMDNVGNKYFLRNNKYAHH
jgi:hypothetical protein